MFSLHIYPMFWGFVITFFNSFVLPITDESFSDTDELVDCYTSSLYHPSLDNESVTTGTSDNSVGQLSANDGSSSTV